MEPQHCMLCWSWVMADMQSANGKRRIATKASMTNVMLRGILSSLTGIDARVGEKIQHFPRMLREEGVFAVPQLRQNSMLSIH
jgi:hypothetical protein